MSDPRRPLHHALVAVAFGLVVALISGWLSGTDAPSALAAETGRVIVRFRNPGGPNVSGRGAQAFSTEAVGRSGARLVRVAAGTERETAARLASRPDVLYAEPDGIVRAQLVPNDSLYASNQWNMRLVGAPAAWDLTTGDSGITVAVIDTGFDVAHPDGPLNLVLGCDYVTWNTLGYLGVCPRVADDLYGHGTHVAGIVAARQNNGLYVSGLAPGVTVLVIRTLDAQGQGYVSDVAAAIEGATDAGARVINLSLGGTSSSALQQDAVNYALARGVVVVAAAGNDYGQGSVISYPAGYPGVLAVGAITYDDLHAAYSNMGSYVSLSAPGGSSSSSGNANDAVASLYPIALGSVKRLIGTSQAAPHVAAVAALALSVRPSLTGAEVAGLLRSSAHPLGGTVPNNTFGYGRVDALAAVQAARSLAPTATATVTATSTATATSTSSLTPTLTASVTVTLTPTATPTITATAQPTRPPPPTFAPATSTATATISPSVTTTLSRTATSVQTTTPVTSGIPTSTPTPVPEAIQSATAIPSSTSMSLGATTPSVTVSASLTPTRTPTASISASPTPTFLPLTTTLSAAATTPVVVETGDLLLRVTVPPGIAVGRGSLRLELAGAPMPPIAGYRGLKAVEVSLYAGSDRIGQLDQLLTIDLGYDPSELPNPGLGELSLLIYTSSDGLNWRALTTVVDRANRRVRASVDHLSVFVLVQPLYRQRLDLVMLGRTMP